MEKRRLFPGFVSLARQGDTFSIFVGEKRKNLRVGAEPIEPDNFDIQHEALLIPFFLGEKRQLNKFFPETLRACAVFAK